MVTLFTEQCMHRPREGRGSTRQTSNPKTKSAGEAPPTYRQETAGTGHRGSPPGPTMTNLPTRAEDGRSDSHRPQKAKQTPEQGRQPSGQARPRASPTGPTAKTRKVHPAQPGDRPPQQRRATTATEQPLGPKKEHPGGADTSPLPGKGQSPTTAPRTQQGLLAGRQGRTAWAKKGGGQRRWGSGPKQSTTLPTTATSGRQRERTESHTTGAPPPQPATGPNREGREATPTRRTTTRGEPPPVPQPAPAHKKKRWRTTPTAAPQGPPTTDSSSPVREAGTDNHQDR